MKVLFFMGVYLPRPGGVPRNTHKMVLALRDMGVDVQVFAPHEKGDRHVSLPYPVLRYPRWPVKRILTRVYSAWLYMIHRKWPFDLIHCHGIDPAAYCSDFFKKFTGIPYIVTPRRSNILKKERHFFHRRRNKRVKKGLLGADRVTALSSEIESIVNQAGVPSSRIVPIPHGIDPTPYQMAPPMNWPKPYILALGRLVAFKGFDLLINAFSIIENRWKNIDLIIIGSGPKEEQLKGMVSRLGLEGRVHLVGRKEGEGKRSFYKGALFFVLPSYPGNEGFPNVVLEAMASGLPVVATKVSGAQDIVIHEKTGYLVPTGDKEALASTMERLLSRPDAIKRVHIENHLEGYRHENIMKRYIELYHLVIGEAGKRE